MTSPQAEALNALRRELHMSDGELLWLARLCSADETLSNFAQVTRADAEDMIRTLEDFKRYAASGSWPEPLEAEVLR